MTDRVFQLRCKGAEKELWRRAAGGGSVSAWARQVLNLEAEKQVAESEEVRARKEERQRVAEAMRPGRSGCPADCPKPKGSWCKAHQAIR